MFELTMIDTFTTKINPEAFRLIYRTKKNRGYVVESNDQNAINTEIARILKLGYKFVITIYNPLEKKYIPAAF